MQLSLHEFRLPHLPNPVNPFSLYGLLCAVLIRISSTYNRLILNSHLLEENQHQYVPWKVYRLDQYANITIPLLLHIFRLYEQKFRDTNPNCVVIWHNLCILSTADIRLLERAAGRGGREAIRDARHAITIWARSPAARRACLHSAQAFRTLSHRKCLDGTAFQSIRALFLAALVLGFYILCGPEVQSTGIDDSHNKFDLINVEIDWNDVGEEGLTDPSYSATSLHEPRRTESPALNFIRFGGPILFGGKIYQPGVRHAQRMLLDFASLLGEVDKHWSSDYTEVLYSIHDLMVTLDSTTTEE